MTTLSIDSTQVLPRLIHTLSTFDIDKIVFRCIIELVVLLKPLF